MSRTYRGGFIIKMRKQVILHPAKMVQPATIFFYFSEIYCGRGHVALGGHLIAAAGCGMQYYKQKIKNCLRHILSGNFSLKKVLPYWHERNHKIILII